MYRRGQIEKITKINNGIQSIVKKLFKTLYKCKDQRETNLLVIRENITESEEIITEMTNEVLQAIRCTKKCKCSGKDGITIVLIK